MSEPLWKKIIPMPMSLLCTSALQILWEEMSQTRTSRMDHRDRMIQGFICREDFRFCIYINNNTDFPLYHYRRMSGHSYHLTYVMCIVNAVVFLVAEHLMQSLSVPAL